MAKTWTKSLVPINVEDRYTLRIPVLNTAEVGLGAMVLYDATNQYVTDELDAAAVDDDTLIGVSGGESRNGNTEDLQVYTKGLFKATLVSAAYAHGAGLKYDDTADNGSLVADGSAATIGWFFSMVDGRPSSGAASIVEGIIYLDIMYLEKLWDAVSA